MASKHRNSGNALIVVVVCLAIIIGAIVIVGSMAKSRPAPETRPVSQAAMLVDAIAAEEAAGPFRIEAQGTVRPVTQTRLAAEVGGRLVEISDRFVAGGFFEAGDVLARIDPSDYEAALLQAEAELASAMARLADETARSEQARRDWIRMNGESRQPSELVLRLPQVAEAEAAVQAAEAGVMRARRNLERTEIRLPYDGLVRSRDVDLGQYVAPGTALGVTFSVATAEVRLPLSNQDLAYLDLPSPGRSGDWQPPVRLRGEVAGQRGEWEGRIIRTEGVVDENTRLSYAVVEISDPYGLRSTRRQVPLQIGTFVEAEIEGRDATGLIVLPRQALRQDDRLYLIDAEGKLEIRSVEVIRSTPDRVYLQNSIKPGDPVIMTAIQAPIPGLAVRMRDSAESVEPELRVLPAGELAAAPEEDES
ncbi:efflux RND transporter periplasmic adaptor subunit [Wenzhouxiangella marina]|uniref:Efflux transporter, RND family, MFP subunit n=1 Tax=Wenzhouxiangella marina TaxID=1579979 RepID=A0A0K0XTW2_9GAMM|nr:efflux RND transporter periplasmic adaptor subunit [Wenzhouxiangella marina]AKS41062.1 Efflux transporter, RND family, MFP subunit [Wenzhouxiangella marina]MBB6087940.1 RND family efflux transporter MFP subunit [Wenzhouxiangella marina]